MHRLMDGIKMYTSHAPLAGMDTGMDTGMDMDGSSQLHPTWIRPRLGNTISRRSKVSLGTVPCPFIRNDKYGLPQVAGMGKMISYDLMTCRMQIDSLCALFRFSPLLCDPRGSHLRSMRG